MTKVEMTEAIILAKVKKGTSWAKISKVVGLSEVFVTSACLGSNSLKPEFARKLCKYLKLNIAIENTLQEFPYKTWERSTPTDPCVYRLYEVAGVYGLTVKELIHEKFGDGIMSAIDFTLSVDKKENPKGDRVVITMNGKFLPYKVW